MRILQVNTSNIAGGATKVAQNLLHAYRDCGFEAWLAVGFKQGDDPNVLRIPNFECLNKWGKLCISFSNKLSPLVGKVRGAWRLQTWLKMVGQPRKLVEMQRGHEYFDFPGTWKLLDMMHNRPDIVHCHNLHGDYFDLRVLPWLSQQVPIVLTMHDTWLLSGHCAHSFDCERWKIGCGQCPNLGIYPPIKKDATEYNWHFKREILKRSQLYVATPSQWVKEKVVQSIVAPAIVEIRVISNGINTEVFRRGIKEKARLNLGIPQSARILLFVANGVKTNPWRDYATLEKAVRKTSEILQDEKLILICLGEKGKPEQLGRIEIHFEEYQKEQAKVASFYQAADLYIHASKADTFSNAIVEAQACGTPVVATEVGAIPELIIDGFTGFLVPPGDADMMADRIIKLLADKNLNKYFAQQGIKRIRNFFDLNHQVKNYLVWYEEILEKWKNFHNSTSE